MEQDGDDFPLDGIVSLAPWGASPGAGGHYSYADFMWVITSNKTLDKPILALSIDSGSNGTSEAHFGAIDNSSYTGEIYPYNVTTA